MLVHTPAGRTRAPRPADLFIGQRLKIARLLAGLSQKQLGQRIGVRWQQIQKYEAGRDRMSVGVLDAAARALDLPPGWFFPDEAARNAQPMLGRRSEQLNLLRDFNAIESAELRRTARLLVRGLALQSAGQPAALAEGE